MAENEIRKNRNGNFDVVGYLADRIDAIGTASGTSCASSKTSVNGDAKKISFRKTAHMSTDRDAREYNMNHPNRGHAIIFNHEQFQDPRLSARTGTKVDCEKLEKTFGILGFNVTIHQDLTYLQILEEIRKVAEMDHIDNDCIVITILTHGGHGYIHSKDTIYKFEHISCHFTADKCPSLAGKPKLFFIQACRGENFDSGVDLVSKCEVDSMGKAASFSIPAHADFLFVYSTVPGFYSWRNVDEGGWFIQALCAELLENGKKESITDILTFVLRKVALDKESNTAEYLSHEKKQIPCFTSSLIRILRFSDKQKIFQNNQENVIEN